MIQLPQQFKNAIKDTPVLSLNCFVNIYPDLTTDRPIHTQYIHEDRVTKLALSEMSLNYSPTNQNFQSETYNYSPLLTTVPAITNKIDIITNKHTIATATLSINNSNYKGVVFSDTVKDLMGSPVEIYYCSDAAEFIHDCMLVYTGVIKRYKQNKDIVDLTLEDITTFKYANKIPSSTLPDNDTVPERDRGKPYPMIYGYVPQCPLISV